MSDNNSQKEEILEPESKKIKIDHDNGNSVADTQLKLKDFILEKILNNRTNRKSVCVLGKFKDKSGVALVHLEKNAFKEEDLDSIGYFSADTELKTFFQNDIYGNYECFPPSTVNGECLSNSSFKAPFVSCCLIVSFRPRMLLTHFLRIRYISASCDIIKLILFVLIVMTLFLNIFIGSCISVFVC